jgi:hypothetical protein
VSQYFWSVLDLYVSDLEETVKIFDALFGCWHKNMSFPLSAKQGQRRSQAATQTGTYVVCLDCGREFAYDWKTMQVVSSGRAVAPVHSHIEVEAKASWLNLIRANNFYGNPIN